MAGAASFTHPKMNPFIQANTGGRLHPADEPSLSPLNRGFLYGDAVYEVWRTYHGVIFAWDEHWARLRQSAKALHMDLALSPAHILAEIRRTVAAYRDRVPGAGDLYIRLQAARGSGPIGLDIALAERTEWVILVQPCPRTSDLAAERGLRLSVATELRRNPAQSLDPSWKTGNYLNNLLCLREARARGFDDVVILNLEGEVTEASVSNIAFARKGDLVTPPRSAGILGGITRSLVLGGVARDAGIRALEEAVRPQDFASFDECFLLSTTKDIVPVGEIDGRAFRIGPGTVAWNLKEAFAAVSRAYASAHPDLTA
jgi:branched-chain amino acid aminotransferase